MTIGQIRTGFTSLGTSTTKTLLGGVPVVLPQLVKRLVAVIPTMADITPTAAQTITCKCEVESADIMQMSPFEVLASPIGSGLGATFNTITGKEEWVIGAPARGGESISVYGSALVANTVAPKAGASLIVDTAPSSPMSQRHYKAGTYTGCGTTADTDVPGTPYNFTNGRAIVELAGFVGSKVIAAGDAILGGIKFSSSEFVEAIPQELTLNPCSFGLGATGSMLIPGVSRQNTYVPLTTTGSVTIKDYSNLHLLPAAAASFISAVGYI